MHVRDVIGGMVLMMAAGCAPLPEPHIVKGDVPATGNATYDDFFLAVRDVRREAEAAGGDEQAAYAGLIKALGLTPYSPSRAAVEESEERAKKLQEKGVLLHLDVAPQPKLAVEVIKGPRNGKPKVEDAPEDPMLKAIEGSAKLSMDLRRRFAALAARVSELERRRAALRAEALAAFREAPQARREQIMAELDAAKGVLSEAERKASRCAGDSAQFVLDLAQAVETGGASRELKGKRPGVAAPVHQAAVNTAPAPKAKAGTPAKKKAKGGGDDFEP